MGERFTIDEVRKYLAEECSERGGPYNWARQNGLSGPHVSAVLRGHRPPNAALLRVLGLEKTILYEDTGHVRPLLE